MRIEVPLRSRARGRRWAAAAAALAFGLVGCGDPPEDEVRPPEMAEVETDDGEVEFEEAFPIEPEDIGDRMLLSGTVVGRPGPNGFFVRTERNQVVWVDAQDSVSAGDRIRAIGPLRAVDAAGFAGWERDWLGDIDPVWAVLRMYYVDADSVRRL